MTHAPEITAICNQWINSYKRLVPGYEAPVYVSWAKEPLGDGPRPDVQTREGKRRPGWNTVRPIRPATRIWHLP